MQLQTKNLLLSIAVFGCLSGKAQIYLSDTTLMPFRIGHATYGNELPHTKDFDTIPCVMLVSNPDGYVKQMNGYNVNKYVPGGWKSGDYYLEAHWEHYAYLDSDKKLLSKSIIIWQSFNLQP